jgi:hypothetical protein
MTDSAAAPLPISVAELRARVGEVIATSAWFEVTQSLINDFAQASHAYSGSTSTRSARPSSHRSRMTPARA